MDALILVKHSLPTIIPDVPAAEWELSDEGRRRCQALAQELRPYRPEGVIASVELKALETAHLLAAHLMLPVTSFPGLYEHARQTAPFGTPQEFEANVARLFARPDELVFGEETADQAHRRFSRAVEAALERFPYRCPVIVAHGTVISLFVSRRCNLDPFPLWQRLGLPSFVVLSRPAYDLITVKEAIS